MNNQIELTEKEADLIMAIRNFKRSYPNGAKQLEWYAQTLFAELLYDKD